MHCYFQFFGSAVFPTAACCCYGVVPIVYPVKDIAKGLRGYMVLSIATCGFLSIFGRQQCTGGSTRAIRNTTILGIEHPLVAPLLKEFVDVFYNLVF